MERIGMLNPMSIRYPADLPITARWEEIVGAIRGNQVLILAGETGSGKTTQLPKMCLDAAGDGAGRGGICIRGDRLAERTCMK
jgi:ATP-dependent helicase HrpA